MIIQDLLDEAVSPAIPTATITASASLSMLGAGKNGGINIAGSPRSELEVIGYFDAELAKFGEIIVILQGWKYIEPCSCFSKTE